MAEYIERNALMQAIGEFFEPVNTVQQSLSLNYGNGWPAQNCKAGCFTWLRQSAVEEVK